MEVNSIRACLDLLEKFLNGTTTVSRSRTSLILVDEVRVVLTDCVITFSELKESIDKLRLSERMHTVDRLKWVSKGRTIEKFLLRLQGARTSMNLMLTTFNW